MSLVDSLFSGLGAALGFAALHYAHDTLGPHGWSCLCPPLGAVAVLLFCMPTAPASQPKAVVGGHVVAGVVAYAVVQAGVAYPEAVAVACTIALMSLFNVVHPPAGAYAFFFAMKGLDEKGILAPGLAGACILIGVQQSLQFLESKLNLKGKVKTKTG